LQLVGGRGPANSEAGLKVAFFKLEVDKVKSATVPKLKVACEKFNITYSNADQAKIDIIRALEVQYEKKVPLSWVLSSKLKSKFIGNDDAAATENTVQKRKSDNITIGDGFQTTLNLSAKCHSAPRVALAEIDPNSASRP